LIKLQKQKKKGERRLNQHKNFLLFKTNNMKNLYFAPHRLVFFGPNEGPSEGVESADGGEEQSPFEDPEKRWDVYRKAEEKIVALEARGDEKSMKQAERLRKRVERAKQDESDYDSSMAIMEASALQRKLFTLAQRDSAVAAAAKKREKEGDEGAAELAEDESLDDDIEDARREGAKAQVGPVEVEEQAEGGEMETGGDIPPFVRDQLIKMANQNDPRTNKDKGGVRMKIFVDDDEYEVYKVGGGGRIKAKYNITRA